MTKHCTGRGRQGWAPVHLNNSPPALLVADMHALAVLPVGERISLLLLLLSNAVLAHTVKKM
jgi:hypothetical protein